MTEGDARVFDDCDDAASHIVTAAEFVIGTQVSAD
jgi:hypothetical protein